MSEIGKALDDCYPTRPQTIDLQNERKNGLMDTRKLGKITWNLLAALGACAVLYGLLILVKPDAIGRDVLLGIEPTEAGHLRKIGQYCFNAVPQLRDGETCRVWADRYAQLRGAEPGQLALFKAESEGVISESLGKRGVHPKWEAEAEAATVPGKPSQGEGQ